MRTVGTEHGVRWIIGVPFGIVADLFDHLRRVVAGEIPLEAAGQLAAAFRVREQFLLVVLHLRYGSRAGKEQAVHAVDGAFEFRVHGLYVADGSADAFGRHLEAEAVPGLQQHVFRAHQALAHRAVGGLAEIAALGVLQMGPAGYYGDLNIR